MLHFLFKKNHKILVFIAISLFTVAQAAYLSNGFVVTSKTHEQKNKMRGYQYIYFFPHFSGGAHSIESNINNAVEQFVKSYKMFVNQQNTKVQYRLENGSDKYFSLRFDLVDANLKTVRTDVLNFYKNSGKMIDLRNIINCKQAHVSYKILEMLRAQDKNAAKNITDMRCLLSKINNREITFYFTQESGWHMIWNKPNEQIDIKLDAEFICV
ncbi:hypothetical protein Sarmat_00923 [Rickettsiales endosymbiont of Paramecium tredecaurelia]|uniref:hypothetical protein n=1 Tax=Candidatus Sarmatiella mevalonica TaxID=2770581 RepID=UPI0019219AA2|nr:hypothetical protein [Candidatus Sarmatiella mevalonica]MBL3285057.1 hypothetical protein [Candidatus Sarmatiella mevalonica]